MVQRLIGLSITDHFLLEGQPSLIAGRSNELGGYFTSHDYRMKNW